MTGSRLTRPFTVADLPGLHGWSAATGRAIAVLVIDEGPSCLREPDQHRISPLTRPTRAQMDRVIGMADRLARHYAQGWFGDEIAEDGARLAALMRAVWGVSEAVMIGAVAQTVGWAALAQRGVPGGIPLQYEELRNHTAEMLWAAVSNSVSEEVR